MTLSNDITALKVTFKSSRFLKEHNSLRTYLNQVNEESIGIYTKSKY